MYFKNKFFTDCCGDIVKVIDSYEVPMSQYWVVVYKYVDSGETESMYEDQFDDCFEEYSKQELRERKLSNLLDS